MVRPAQTAVGEKDDLLTETGAKSQIAEAVALINSNEKLDAGGPRISGNDPAYSHSRRKFPSRQIWITLGSSIAYFIVGLVRAYSSSALPSMEEHDDYLLPSKEARSWIGAIPPLGAFLGSLAAGPLMHTFGRRRTLQIAAPLKLGAWTWLAMAPSLTNVLISRWLTGFCVGIALPTTQVYVSECCAPDIRGRLSSIPALMMSFGILVSYIFGSWIPWRQLAWVSVSMAGILFVALLPLPESPVWLKVKGSEKQARAASAWLHLPTTNDNIEMKEKASANNDTDGADNERNQVEKPEINKKGLFTREVFFSGYVLKPLGIGMVLLVFQQVSGIDAIIFFTVEIFKNSGSSIDDHLAAIIVGLVQLLSNGVSTVLIDRAGRRPLLMTSGVIMTIATAAMGYAFYAGKTQSSFLGYLPLISLITFMIGFSLGFGGVPFVLLGELFPANYRSALSSFAASLNLLTMFSVIKTYHVFETYLTSAGTFWLYSSFCAASVLFVAFCVPETKGKSLQEIEKHFRFSPALEKQEKPTAEV